MPTPVSPLKIILIVIGISIVIAGLVIGLILYAGSERNNIPPQDSIRVEGTISTMTNERITIHRSDGSDIVAIRTGARNKTRGSLAVGQTVVLYLNNVKRSDGSYQAIEIW